MLLFQFTVYVYIYSPRLHREALKNFSFPTRAMYTIDDDDDHDDEDDEAKFVRQSFLSSSFWHQRDNTHNSSASVLLFSSNWHTLLPSHLLVTSGKQYLVNMYITCQQCGVSKKYLLSSLVTPLVPYTFKFRALTNDRRVVRKKNCIPPNLSMCIKKKRRNNNHARLYI